MDIISLPEAPSGLWYLTIVLGTLTVVVLGMAVATAWSRVVGVIICVLALVGSVVGFISFQNSLDAYKEAVADRKAAIIDEADEMYGVELSDEDFEALEFPAEKPKDDFVVYGTFSETEKSGDGYDRHDITLIWDGGELLLASSVDGEQFTELSR